MKKNKEVLRTLKFVLFSVSAGIIEMIVFGILNEIGEWPYWPCYLAALVVSVLWNFTLNRKYTFQSANNVPIAMIKVAIFYCVFTPVSTIVGNYLAEGMGWNEYLVTILNMGCNFVTEYIYDRIVVFGKTIDTNEIARKQAEKSEK